MMALTMALGVCCVHAADANSLDVAEVVFNQRGEDLLDTTGADNIFDVFGLRGVDCSNADVVCAVSGRDDGFLFGVCRNANDSIRT
jgi:hypothetical protein